jgi:hypothetical protein
MSKCCLGFTGIGLALLAGCATPFRPPPDVAHIKLERRDSAKLIADKIWLERRDGGLFVTGYVMPKLGVSETMGSHVLISLRDANGAELRSIPADFHPRQIPVRIRVPHALGTYSCQLDPLPSATATIVASASDDRPETSPQPSR